MLEDRQLATLLAALRHWQETHAKLPPDALATRWLHFPENTRPLSVAEIDHLCDMLNFPETQ